MRSICRLNRKAHDTCYFSKCSRFDVQFSCDLQGRFACALQHILPGRLRLLESAPGPKVRQSYMGWYHVQNFFTFAFDTITTIASEFEIPILTSIGVKIFTAGCKKMFYPRRLANNQKNSI